MLASWSIRMLACCFSDGMLSVVVKATREGVISLLAFVMLFMVLCKCLVLVEWSRVSSASFVLFCFHDYFVVHFCV